MARRTARVRRLKPGGGYQPESVKLPLAPPAAHGRDRETLKSKWLLSDAAAMLIEGTAVHGVG